MKREIATALISLLLFVNTYAAAYDCHFEPRHKLIIEGQTATYNVFCDEEINSLRFFVTGTSVAESDGTITSSTYIAWYTGWQTLITDKDELVSHTLPESITNEAGRYNVYFHGQATNGMILMAPPAVLVVFEPESE